MTSPPGARSGAAAIPRRPIRVGDLVVVAVVGDPRVGDVVRRPDRLAELGGEPVDPAAHREAQAEQPGLDLGIRRAGHHDRDEVRAVLGHPGQVRAVGPQQAHRLVDDPVEDDLRLAQRGDPGGDVAQGPFRVGPPGDGRLRALQLLDQPRVGDRDGRLVGQPAEDRGIDVVEGVAVAPVDLDRAERSLVADDRGDDQVADPRPLGHRVGLREVLELAGEVVARGDDPSLEHRPTGQPLADAEAGRAHRSRAGHRSVPRRRRRRGRPRRRRTRRSPRRRHAAGGAPRRRSAGGGRRVGGWR